MGTTATGNGRLLQHLHDLDTQRQIILSRQEVTVRKLRSGKMPASWAKIGAALGVSRQAAFQTWRGVIR